MATNVQSCKESSSVRRQENIGNLSSTWRQFYCVIDEPKTWNYFSTCAATPEGNWF